MASGSELNTEFESLYRSHYRRVFGLCLRLLGRADQAEDAAQEVFVRAYRALDSYDASAPFAPWVLRIASNYCIDRLRRRSGSVVSFDDEHADSVVEDNDTPTAFDTIARSQTGAQVRAAIAALPEKFRLPVVLAYYSEASYDEIAATLGITRNHVGVLLLRAKHALRRTLTETEETP